MKQLLIFDNFLDEDTYEECINYSNILFEKHFKNLYNNKCKWENNIVKDSELIHIRNMPSEIDLYKKIEGNLKKINYERIHCINFYWFMPGSHIPWHNDYKYESGLTIYLNDVWDKDHSGYFLFADNKNNEVKAIIPKRNMAVQQIGGVEHCVTPTTKDSNIRKTIQIFFTK
jgi:hypothetical protein